MRLETERLIIRPFEAADAAEAHPLFCDEDTMRRVGMYPPLETPEESLARVLEWQEEGSRHAIILRESGALLGYIAVNPDSEEEREDTRELGFATLPQFRRNGYMREAVLAVLQALRREGVAYVWACCFQGNEASEQLIRSLHFELQQEGTYEVEGDRCYTSLEFRITL